MFNQDDVKRLVDEVGALKLDPAVQIESTMFGLSAVLFDPQTGQVMTLAQPQRVDVGQSEVFYTPMQVLTAVQAGRNAHMHMIRAAGFFSIEAYNEAQKRAGEARDLERKQAAERVAMDEAHAEATAKAAAEQSAATKRDEPKAPAPEQRPPVEKRTPAEQTT